LTRTEKTIEDFDHFQTFGNHFSKENWLMDNADSVAYDRLIVNKLPVVFIGDGAGSFSLAVAALRDSLDNLQATELVRTNLDDLETVRRHIPNGENASVVDSLHKYPIFRTYVQQISRVYLLNPNPEVQLPILGSYAKLTHFKVNYDIDGTKLVNFFQHKTNERYRENIFFQCPWAFPEKTSELLLQFLVSAAAEQKDGDHLFIGYDKGYYLDKYNLLTFYQTAAQLHYVILADDSIIQQKALMYGYQHFSRSGKSLILEISTICMKKQSPVDHAQATATAAPAQAPGEEINDQFSNSEI
jgi:hypothetical protein